MGERVTLRGVGTATELTLVQPGGDHSPITVLRVTDAVCSETIEEVSSETPSRPGYDIEEGSAM